MMEKNLNINKTCNKEIKIMQYIICFTQSKNINDLFILVVLVPVM